MREQELIDLGACAVCKKKMLEPDTGPPLFYKVTIQRGGFDAAAISRRAGLGMMVGESDQIARVLGPDEHLTTDLGDCHSVIVHEACAGNVGHLIMLFPEDGD